MAERGSNGVKVLLSNRWVHIYTQLLAPSGYVTKITATWKDHNRHLAIYFKTWYIAFYLVDSTIRNPLMRFWKEATDAEYLRQDRWEKFVHLADSYKMGTAAFTRAAQAAYALDRAYTWVKSDTRAGHVTIHVTNVNPVDVLGDVAREAVKRAVKQMANNAVAEFMARPVPGGSLVSFGDFTEIEQRIMRKSRLLQRTLLNTPRVLRSHWRPETVRVYHGRNGSPTGRMVSHEPSVQVIVPGDWHLTSTVHDPKDYRIDIADLSRQMEKYLPQIDNRTFGGGIAKGSTGRFEGGRMKIRCDDERGPVFTPLPPVSFRKLYGPVSA